MRMRAVIIHLNGFVSVTPLVGGYLKAMALADQNVRDHWQIDLYSTYVATPVSEVLDYLVARQPQLVAFSVYTWNVRAVFRLLPALQGVLPKGTRFMLGGVEITNCAERLLTPDQEGVIVCNGEGEQTFRDTLRELTVSTPDLSQVPGLTFAVDGEWIDTGSRQRLRDLSQIPSPYLEDLFTDDDMREIALFETNRGCPFKCEFCFWGGAVGAKVNKLQVERLKEEISYIARRGTKTLTICDANFGILAHDLELAEHIARMRRDHRAPLRVTFSSAKNSADRVEQVARIFAEAGLLSNQAISMQSMSPAALKQAKRDNIRTEDYLRLQRRLNEWGLPSFVELIWPLPGETLDSFKEGVEKLCRMGAQSFSIYPLLWLNNVGFEGRAEELGITTLQEDDPYGDGKLVIRTRDVPYADYLRGLQYALAALLLYSSRGLYSTLLALDATGSGSIRQVLDQFVAWMNEAQERPDLQDNELVTLWQDGRRRFENLVKSTWRGGVVHAVLHSAREDWDALLQSFVDEHLDQWCEGGEGSLRTLIETCAEFDLLARPYLFLGAQGESEPVLKQVSVLDRRRGRLQISAPVDVPALVARCRQGEALTDDLLKPAAYEIDIDHRTGQTFRLPGKRDEEHYWHAQQALREIARLEPRLRTSAAEVAAI